MRFCAHGAEGVGSCLPALVLVHGGGLAADSWGLTIEEVNRQAPELTVLAVDLPGRRGKPGDLRTVSIADCVDSIVADIETAGLDDIVIVGHSIAGVTLPGVITKLGNARVREMILAAAFVPVEGATIVDTGPFKSLAHQRVKKGQPSETPRWLARFAYLNGVPRARRRFMTGKLCAESLAILTESVSRQDMPDDVPRT
jgi:pimeloyl-ACP methyl ester carboxylesterase